MNEIHTTEDLLRSEIEDLKRQLEKHKEAGGAVGPDSAGDRPGAGGAGGRRVLRGLPAATPPRIGAGGGIQSRSGKPAGGDRAESQALGGQQQPGSAGQHRGGHGSAVLARASGYIKRRYADIGDRVKQGEVLAEIEAPELDQQIRQAKATVDQANSTIEQAQAALEQGRSNENLARVTAQRWENLSKKGVVSRQENDTYQLQWAAQKANVQALEKAVAAARNNASSVEANVARLNDLLEYQTVRAPFAGVITLRNVDTGVLVNEGSTLLYRIAQTDRLRTYVNVPQADAESVRVGQHAVLVIPDLPGRGFPGAVTRTANALDPATRTLLVEVQVPNPAALLMPGMYAQVDLSVPGKIRLC